MKLIIMQTPQQFHEEIVEMYVNLYTQAFYIFCFVILV
ncbi:MAG: hypothetical protein RL728_1146, partial [Bacteroidota bacterium]